MQRKNSLHLIVVHDIITTAARVRIFVTDGSVPLLKLGFSFSDIPDEPQVILSANADGTSFKSVPQDDDTLSFSTMSKRGADTLKRACMICNLK